MTRALVLVGIDWLKDEARTHEAAVAAEEARPTAQSRKRLEEIQRHETALRNLADTIPGGVRHA